MAQINPPMPTVGQDKIVWAGIVNAFAASIVGQGNANDLLLSALIAQLNVLFAKEPMDMVSGAITRDANGTPTSFAVKWPDGATGTFTLGTTDATFIGAINSFSVTHVQNGTTTTYTQPVVTRGADGAPTNIPDITIG